MDEALATGCRPPRATRRCPGVEHHPGRRSARRSCAYPRSSTSGGDCPCPSKPCAGALTASRKPMSSQDARPARGELASRPRRGWRRHRRRRGKVGSRHEPPGRVHLIDLRSDRAGWAGRMRVPRARRRSGARTCCGGSRPGPRAGRPARMPRRPDRRPPASLRSSRPGAPGRRHVAPRLPAPTAG